MFFLSQCPRIHKIDDTTRKPAAISSYLALSEIVEGGGDEDKNRQRPDGKTMQFPNGVQTPHKPEGTQPDERTRKAAKETNEPSDRGYIDTVVTTNIRACEQARETCRKRRRQ